MAKSKWHLESEKHEENVSSLPQSLRDELLKIFPRDNDNREETCLIHKAPKWHRVFYPGGFKGIIAHYWRCNDCWAEEDLENKKRRKRFEDLLKRKQ